MHSRRSGHCRVMTSDLLRWVMGGLVHELKDLVIGNFGSFIGKHAPRECNRVTHELALIGSRSNNLVPSVLAGVPSCITVLVSCDLVDMAE